MASLLHPAEGLSGLLSKNISDCPGEPPQFIRNVYTRLEQKAPCAVRVLLKVSTRIEVIVQCNACNISSELESWQHEGSNCIFKGGQCSFVSGSNMYRAKNGGLKTSRQTHGI